MTRRVVEKASLPEITLFGLRHTHCTVLLNKGVNVKVIAERLGNTPAIIYEVYEKQFRFSVIALGLILGLKIKYIPLTIGINAFF